ncbi:MAG: hypothetical protein OXK79_03390, partial [Chloroflexota bacterium]|nr:hypothetical protein [Chloroflexota bacterium]
MRLLDDRLVAARIDGLQTVLLNRAGHSLGRQHAPRTGAKRRSSVDADQRRTRARTVNRDSSPLALRPRWREVTA